MYIFDTPDFREAVRWFRENKASFFSYLCVCISDNSSKGRKLFKYIHKNMERIDNITGDDICFLATVKNRGKRMSIPSRIYDEEAEFFDDMDRHEAGIMQEKMSNRIFNDVISYCDWQRINLPALLFTPLHNPFSTFGCVVKSAADLNLAFELINVFTMYKQDLRKIDEVYNKMKENRIREKALTEQKELKDYLSTASLDEQVDKLIKIIRANTEANDSFISLLKNNPSKYYPKAMGEFVTLRELPEAIEVTRQIRTIIKARKRLDALKELLSADKIIPRHTQLNEAEIQHLDCNRQDKKNNLLTEYTIKLSDEFGLSKKLSEDLLNSYNLKDIVSCAQSLINGKKSSIVWICPKCKKVVPEGIEVCPYCLAHVKDLLKAEAEHYERMSFITYATDEHVKTLEGRTEIQTKQNQYEKAKRDGEFQAQIDKAKTKRDVVRQLIVIKNEISDYEKSQLITIL